MVATIASSNKQVKYGARAKADRKASDATLNEILKVMHKLNLRQREEVMTFVRLCGVCNSAGVKVPSITDWEATAPDVKKIIDELIVRLGIYERAYVREIESKEGRS